MYRIFYVMDDNMALLDMTDKSYWPKGYIVDENFNIIGSEVMIDSVIKFNPYVEDPSDEDAKRRFIKDKKRFVEIG
mgnify:CR=1 FL=1